MSIVWWAILWFCVYSSDSVKDAALFVLLFAFINVLWSDDKPRDRRP